MQKGKEVSNSMHTEGKDGREERRAGPACLRVETREERESERDVPPGLDASGLRGRREGGREGGGMAVRALDSALLKLKRGKGQHSQQRTHSLSPHAHERSNEQTKTSESVLACTLEPGMGRQGERRAKEQKETK